MVVRKQTRRATTTHYPSLTLKEQHLLSAATSALQISLSDLIPKASCGESALAHVPPSSSRRCDMRFSPMSALILRSARSVQDAAHKTLQPLDRLMLGDRRDRL